MNDAALAGLTVQSNVPSSLGIAGNGSFDELHLPR